MAMALLMGLSCSGCIWLAIPSLAYEGYRYHETGSWTGSAPTAPTQNAKKTQSSTTQ